jgi:hypothetical protein
VAVNLDNTNGMNGETTTASAATKTSKPTQNRISLNDGASRC